jgi:hypothetical protein
MSIQSTPLEVATVRIMLGGLWGADGRMFLVLWGVGGCSQNEWKKGCNDPTMLVLYTDQ